MSYSDKVTGLNLQPGSVNHITVEHDDDCPLLSGTGECSCNAHVRTGLPSPGTTTAKPATTPIKNKTAADCYNALCRIVDSRDAPDFLKSHFRKAPLYCFDDLSDILHNSTYTGLACNIPRTVILATNTRCVVVDVFTDETGDTRIHRLEPGAEFDMQQVVLVGDSIGVALPGIANGRFEWTAIGKDFFAAQEIPDHPKANHPKADMRMIRASLRDSIVVCAMLNRIDSPRHYVLSESPSRIRTDGPKSPRYDNRERWIVLDKDAVIKRYKSRAAPIGTHASPAPHLRRGHFKTLSHDRYVNLKGQRIPVRPSWVGDREWNGEHGLKYRVVSRPGSTANQA